MNKTSQGYTLVELIIALAILLFGGGGMALVIWVAVHFLRKCW